MKPNLQNFTITDFSKPSPLMRRLYLIVKETLCPEMDYRFFLHFYLSSKPHHLQVSFLQLNGKDIGFFTCAYAFMPFRNRQVVICRVAIGVLTAYHGGVMPFAALCRRMIAYKLRRPLREVYMVAYLANPIVFSTIARYTAEHWPCRREPPARILQLKETILKVGNLAKHEIRPWVIKLHFHVALPPELLRRIYASKDPGVQFYLQKIPEVNGEYGLMTIVPVRWGNVLSNLWKVLVVRMVKKQWKTLRQWAGRLPGW